MGQGIMRIVTKEFASAGAFQTLAGMNLRAVRMDRLKENFQRFRNCGSPRQANCFQLRRRRLTMRSRLAPTRRAAHAAAARGVERQRETGPQENVRVQVLRIRRNRLGSSRGQSTGTRTRPQVLLKVEFYRRKP